MVNASQPKVLNIGLGVVEWLPKPKLLSLIEHDHICDRIFLLCVILELAKRNVTEAVPRLIELLEHDDSRVIANCAFALGNLQATEAIPYLVELLDHYDPAVLAQTAYSLGELQATEVTPRLTELLEHDDDEVVASSILAFVHLQASKLVPRLIKMLEHENRKILATTVFALGWLQTTEAIPRLIPFLEHDDSHITACAAMAIGFLRATEATPRLIELLNHHDDKVVQSAAFALGRLPATEATPRLIELLRHNNANVIASAASALGCHHVTEARHHLISLLDHEDPFVLAHVVASLGRLQAIDATHQPVRRLADIFSRTADSDTRDTLCLTTHWLPAEYRDHIEFLELALDPHEDRRVARIHHAFKLRTIQEILERVLDERSRRRANGEQVRAAMQSEFWLSAKEDPLFSTSIDRVMDDLFPNIRRRMSGVVHRIISKEHTPPSGKKTNNGKQRRVWQNTNYSDRFLVVKAGQIIEIDRVAEVYGFLKEASAIGLISPRQQRLFELLSWNGLTKSEAAYKLGVATKTVGRDWRELSEIISRYFFDANAN